MKTKINYKPAQPLKGKRSQKPVRVRVCLRGKGKSANKANLEKLEFIKKYMPEHCLKVGALWYISPEASDASLTDLEEFKNRIRFQKAHMAAREQEKIIEETVTHVASQMRKLSV